MDDHPLVSHSWIPCSAPKGASKADAVKKCQIAHVHVCIRYLTAYSTDPQNNAHSQKKVSMRHWALHMFAQGPALALPADHADML